MDTKLELGIPELDEEHREMFRRIADVRLLLLLTPGASHDAVLSALRDLEEFCHQHLATEEAMIVGWDGAEDHAMAHRRLTGVLYRLLTKHQQEQPDFAIDVLDILTYSEDWLKIHIEQEDSQFVTYVLSNSEGDRASCLVPH